MLGLGTMIKSAAGAVVHAASKNKATIELVVGVGAVVAGTIYTVAKSEKGAAEIKQYKETKEQIKLAYYETKGEGEELTPEEKKEVKTLKRKNNTRFAVGMLKIYWPVLLMNAGGFTLVGMSHATMLAREKGAIAAAMGYSALLANYRQAVQNDVGEEHEKELYESVTVKGTEIKSEDGTESQTVFTSIDPSNTTLIFDRSIPQFVSMYSPEANLKRNLEHIDNTIGALREGLLYRKVIPLNDIRDDLGFDKTDDGLVFGYIYDPDVPRELRIPVTVEPMDDESIKITFEAVQPLYGKMKGLKIKDNE